MLEIVDIYFFIVYNEENIVNKSCMVCSAREGIK